MNVWRASVAKGRSDRVGRWLAGKENGKQSVSFLGAFSVLAAGCGCPVWDSSFEQRHWCPCSMVWHGSARLGFPQLGGCTVLGELGADLGSGTLVPVPSATSMPAVHKGTRIRI